MTIKRKAFSAVRWTTTAAVGRALLQLGQVSVLARILAPADYGLMAVVTVVQNFATIFSDLGLNSAFVQKQDVTEEERASLFWLNVSVAVVLAGVICAFSPLLASFFGDARLVGILLLAATTIVLTALGQQVRMTAEKALNFRPIALLEIGAGMVGFVVAVVAALAGMGARSLVLGTMSSAGILTTLAWLFISGGWRPRPRLRWSEVRPYLAFGGSAMLGSILNQVTLGADLLIGGRLLTKSELGLYSVPRSLTLQLQYMVNPIITRVGFPLIAQVQKDQTRVRAVYLQTLNMTASTNAPLYAGIAFFAPSLVHLLLGSNWAGSIAMLRIFAIWGFLRSTGNPVGGLLLGLGRADVLLRWNIGWFVALPPVLWWGSRHGVDGLALALLTSVALSVLPLWLLIVRPLCGATLLAYTTAIFRPLALAAVSLFPAYLLAGYVHSDLVRVALAIVIGGAGYIGLSHLANRDWTGAMMTLLGLRRA